MNEKNDSESYSDKSRIKEKAFEYKINSLES